MFNLTLRDSDAGSVVLRTIALGMKPMLLIEPKMLDDGEVEIDIDCTDLSVEGIAEMCDLIASALREGEATELTKETPDA